MSYSYCKECNREYTVEFVSGVGYLCGACGFVLMEVKATPQSNTVEKGYTTQELIDGIKDDDPGF
jgi:hypothetical protein